MKNKIVTLFGGSGQIGSNLIGSLIKKNYRVICVTRSAFRNTHLKTQATPGAIELLEWNTENLSEVENAIKNSDIVINLVGILYATRKQKFYKLHSKLPEAIAKICEKSNVEKLIQKNKKLNTVFFLTHPIAGSEVSGPEFGNKNLFKDKWCIILKGKNALIDLKKLPKDKNYRYKTVDSITDKDSKIILAIKNGK